MDSVPYEAILILKYGNTNVVYQKEFLSNDMRRCSPHILFPV